MKIFDSIFKQGYIRTFKTNTTKEEVKRLLLYMCRWQLSTPILAVVMIVLASLNYWLAAIIANIIGSLIFYWVDKFIFKPTQNKNKEK